MKLKRLQLQGYKTFASRTDFDFDGGITAIVGPNGSGKSNIADALRWVLGEQSYSTLRGKRTVDMIFAGSQERARAGMAQAILTLDNSDGWLPIDYTEVEIGRRAFRSGENEYLLNGQKVRLRDLQELLATSGLAERTYTIIGQGLIDQALSLRAEERRALFEEAAGVSHYQMRRAETLRRLQETQHNLERVHDILSEIRPRLGGLKRQANRARNYEQIQVDLRHLLRRWYGYQWEQRKQALRAQRQAAAEAEAAWKDGRSRVAQQQEQIDRKRREINRRKSQRDERRQSREQLREQLEGARRQAAIFRERNNLLQQQLALIEQELPRLEEQRRAAQKELEAATGELQAAQERLAEQQGRLERFNQSFQAQQAEINHWRTTSSRLERRQQEEQNRLSQTLGQLSQLQERLEERREGPDNEQAVANAEQEAAELQNAVERAHQRVQTVNEERRVLQEQERAARQQLQTQRQALAEASRRSSRLAEEVARLEARCDLLDQMRHREVKVGSGVSVIGRVAGRVRIPAEYQPAIEAALGARLATLVLPDEANLWQLLSRNGQHETVLAVAAADARPAPLPPPPQHPDVVDWAANLISAQDEIGPVARLLFNPILLVRSREAAYELGRELPAGALAVTLDGFVVHAGGLVEITPGEHQRSILAREEAWRAAGRELEVQKGKAAAAQTELSQQQQAVEEAQEALNRLTVAERRMGHQVNEANQRLTQAQRQLDRATQQRDFLLRQQQAAAEESARLAQRIESTQKGIAEHREEVVRLESRLGEARLKLSALPVAEAEQQRQTRHQEIDTARTIVAGRQAVVESRRATLNQIEGQLRRQQERQQELQRQAVRLDLQGAESKQARLEAQIATLDAELNPLTETLAEEQRQLEELEEAAAGLQRQAHDLETHYTQMQITLSQRENQLEGLVERIKADLGLVALNYDEEQGGQTPLPMDEVVERLPEVKELPADIEETIQDYRAQLNRMGAVNPDAPAEYAQTQERYTFLSQQVEDLQETEQKLRRVIADLDDLTSRAFSSTVKKVNSIFGELFERLFGGGSAHLVLTDPDDLTISGVDIVARLPGRRQQRLALLSGGERSLTAAALIFALLKVAPPPFCVLDEVDAMLDEANVTRFRSVLRDLAKQSQFIVITHNRGTVQVAQTVYGISMGVDSASQVISIRPDEYVNGK